MNIILLSGGSGKRLWPLSNDIRSKQFIKIFKKEDGTYESMVQRVYRQIKKVDTDATVTIATGKTQVSAIHNQLGEDVGISVEPCRRDTFPAIALATAYLVDVMHKFEQQIMFAEKSWGSFKVIDVETTSLTIKVTLNPGHSMNYHSHKNRDEVWVVISGEGKTIVDGMEQMVKPGDVITMSAGCRHTVIADTELKLIEVQLGADINVHDKQKFELEQ